MLAWAASTRVFEMQLLLGHCNLRLHLHLLLHLPLHCLRCQRSAKDTSRRGNEGERNGSDATLEYITTPMSGTQDTSRPMHTATG